MIDMKNTVLIPYRVGRWPTTGVSEMTIWLEETLRLQYAKDWDWNHGENGWLYGFKDEQNAVLFALRWS